MCFGFQFFSLLRGGLGISAGGWFSTLAVSKQHVGLCLPTPYVCAVEVVRVMVAFLQGGLVTLDWPGRHGNMDLRCRRWQEGAMGDGGAFVNTSLWSVWALGG